ncbi:MAG: DUF2177 family protein [Bacteroidales bacterium]|nr:DUF2177 family protein [Bacteroidales bacterium]
MAEYLKIYGVAFIAFVTIDLVWLVFIANNLYKKYLGYLMRPSPNWIAAIIFYLLFLAGLVYFVIRPAVEKGDWKSALFAGMFFGLVTYATYDLTNLATVKGWPVLITAIDLVWGTVLGGMVSVITWWIVTRI